MPSSKPMTRQSVTKPDTTPNYISKLRELEARDAAALTEAEVEFMDARSSYMTEESTKKFAKRLKALKDKRAAVAKKEAEVKANQKKAAPKKK